MRDSDGVYREIFSESAPAATNTGGGETDSIAFPRVPSRVIRQGEDFSSSGVGHGLGAPALVVQQPVTLAQPSLPFDGYYPGHVYVPSEYVYYSDGFQHGYYCAQQACPPAFQYGQPQSQRQPKQSTAAGESKHPCNCHEHGHSNKKTSNTGGHAKCNDEPEVGPNGGKIYTLAYKAREDAADKAEKDEAEKDAASK
jgi:hypothetical protein